ncbi:hypothetical protein C0995_010055 [Termitomyces sp. Mi166|nr:hypothetical protein C0995_010055 [Termitomyces sp. Mi166\
MASRRLDISSLLCNDQISDPVILAPHLKQPSQPSSSSSSQFIRHTSSSTTPPTFSASSQMLHSPRPSSSRHAAVPAKLQSFGLEALVHVATEERRRLSGSESEIQTRQPVASPVQPILVRSPVYSLPRHRDDSHPPQDVPYRSPQPAYYSPQLDLHRQRIHHEQLLSHEQQQQQQQQMYLRDRQPTFTERQILSPPSHSMLHVESPPQPLSRPLTTHLHSSGRKSDPGQPHHLLHPDSVPPLSPPPFSQAVAAADSGKRRRYSDTPPQVMSVKEQQRIQREREKMMTGDLGYGRPEPIGNSGTTGPRRPESSSGQGRKHLGLVELIMPNHESHRVQPVTAVEVSRNEARIESASHEADLREGGSRHGISQETNTQEMMREGHCEGAHNGNSRNSGSREGGSRLLSPHSRRSPPGSQSGRAFAAKKTEEIEISLHDLLPQATELPEQERKSPLQEREKTTLHENRPVPVQKITVPFEKDVKPEKEGHVVIAEKDTKKRPPSWTMPTLDHSTVTGPVPSKKQRTAPLQTVPVPKAAETDAHEWFLEHFDDYNEPGLSRPLSPRKQSPPACLSPSSRHSSIAKTCTPAPSAVPDAADALEQELEELLPPQVSKVEPDTDMDVDLVTELVAETLDAGDAKTEDVGMEVDVEDELLSLLDDQPPPRRPTTKSVKATPSKVKPPPPPGKGGRHTSPSAMSPSPTAHAPPTGRSASTRPASERGSMPPPTSVAPVRGKEEKATERAASTATPSNKKKKDVQSKSGAKNKATAVVSAGTAATKPRARPGPKPKPKISDASLSTIAAKSKAATGNKKSAASRSRSTSVMPNGSMGAEGSEAKAEKQEEEEESDQEDDKLYCVCKTTYDEDRFMIACDRCDEWYHTQCVNMPDLEVDLVDWFICPLCIEKHPHLNLKTTYRTRCLYGLCHANPSSPEACHRPARGAFSKYCSDECGLNYMQSRVDAWAKKGGKKEKLWETVKGAEKREGVVVCAMEPNGVKTDVDKDQMIKQKKSKTEREMARLNGLLDSIVKLREDIKKEMEYVVWREKLLELATRRAEQIDECGWDQRLCFRDDQCVDLGEGVLESYDLQNGASGDWWCSGKKACDRHAGWQAVRVKDVCKEKEMKNDALYNLTTREREIRKRLEDLLEPNGRDCNDASGKLPLTISNAKLPNGHTKGKTNGDTTTKKGKKRKAPS